MKLTRLQTYFTAWLLYLAFIFSMYPQLKITVMLFSIPLTMLGGWLYLYRGALLTTLGTIAVHFGLFWFYVDDSVPALIHKTLNPFGIMSQLTFSCCTALLKAAQIKYRRLNDSLEEIVAERTNDLDQLTEYLISAQQLENQELYTSLLEKPYLELKSMLATSELLKQKLHEEKHPCTADTEKISMIIKDCIKQLQSMGDYSISGIPATGTIVDSISNLKQQIEQVSTVDIQYQKSTNWDYISAEQIPSLCEIIFEATANALRHADPEYIMIGIEHDDCATSVFVENDGKPLPTGFTEGMGIPLMRYRAGKIGAKLTISPTQTRSTKVICTFTA